MLLNQVEPLHADMLDDISDMLMDFGPQRPPDQHVCLLTVSQSSIHLQVLIKIPTLMFFCLE